jgi:hypothetical protein
MALAAVALLTGVAAGSAQAAPAGNVELLLLKAGFETVPNEHPLCEGVCKTLTPGQLVPYTKAGKKVYAYLSPETNRLYVGNEAEYQRFINMAVLQKLEEKHRPLGTEKTDPQFWNMWQDLYGGR